MSARKLTACLIVLCLTTASLVLVSLPANASIGSADAYGYVWVTNRGDEPTVTYDWKEISATGTSAGFSWADNVYTGPFNIGFDFTFYGVTYSQFNISSNGFIMLGDPYDLYYNYPIPNTLPPNNVIAPFWDDLMVSYSPYNAGAVYYETMGTAPEQQLVVQWDAVSLRNDYDLLTFEVILSETGEIWFQYETMSGEAGSSATIGIENSDGSIGCQYSYDHATVSDGLAVMFYEGPVGLGPDRSMSVYAGQTFNYGVTVRNAQGFPDTFSITSTSTLGWATDVMRTDMSPLADTGVLLAGESLDFIVQIEVPWYPSGPMEMTTVTATSLSDPLVHDYLILNTTVIQATFTDYHEDYGYDSDSDGDYDFLAVDVAVEVAYEGQLGLSCSLRDSAGTTVGYSMSYWNATAGPNNHTVMFSGEDIRPEGVDGTFTVEMNLYDSGDRYIGWTEYTTGPYTISDFEPPAAFFSSPITDEGLDIDSDTLFDQLVVDVPLEVFDAEQYIVVGTLFDYGYSIEIDRITISDYYAPGTHNLEFEFSGAKIHSSGYDGPYVVELTLYQGDYNYVEWTYHETASYLYTDFDPPGAVFVPPHTDYGEDTDSDGYYNHLVVAVDIDCYETGLYDLAAFVYAPSGELFVEEQETLSLTSGISVAHLISLDGHDIRDLGQNGRFELDLYLYDHGTGLEQDQDYHQTSYYYYSDFEQTGVDIYGMDDYGRDTDGDGYWNEVVITVYIQPLETADYLVKVWAELYYYGIDVAYSEDLVHMEEGVLYEHELVLTQDQLVLYGLDPYLYVTTEVRDEADAVSYATYSDWTSYYYIGNFDQRAAYFDSSHSDQGRDDDSDSLYDFIVVTVNVYAPYMSGYYDLWVEANGPAYTYELTFEYVLYLEEGVITPVEVEIPASMVHDQGSGYWYLYMGLSDHFTGQAYDYESYDTNTYYYDYFDPPAVEFAPGHSDQAIDLDGDYLYDYLMVEVHFACYEPGTYTLRADLYGYWGPYISSLTVVDSMTEGNEVVRLMFDGWLLYTYGSSGYFTVEMTIEDSEGAIIDQDTHVTSYYSQWDFEPTPASFSWPHSDYAVDTDDDGLYEHLIVNVSVEASVPGEYVLTGMLYDDYYMFVDDARAEVALHEGVNIVQLRFDAWPMSTASGRPYYVDLELTDEDADVLDTDNYYMGMYYYTVEFDPTTPSIESFWAYDPPVVDGDVSEGEWFGAQAVDLVSADDMNSVLGTMYVLNNQTHLFLLVDASGDLTGSDGDSMMVAFDTYDDGLSDYGHEDILIIEAQGSDTLSAHIVYSASYPEWAIHCSPFGEDMVGHYGLLGAVGFGPTALSWSEHRVYELSIPLSVLMLSPGETIGFKAIPAAYDSDSELYSSWPSHSLTDLDVWRYGDLTLSGEPPLTTVALTGEEGGGGWFMSSVEVELTATGGVGGVNATYYSLDGGDWQEYSEPFTVTSDGAHELRFYSDSVNGSVEPTRTATVGIDTVAPATSVAVTGTEGNDGWITSVATLTFTVSEPASGVSVTWYRLDEGAWTRLSGSSLDVSDEGEHTVEFYSIDVAGHSETVSSAQFKVDVTGPETVATVDGSMVTLAATDAVSGVAFIWYRVDGGSWTAYSGEFEVQGEGTHVVEYFSGDNAGNNETVKSVAVEGSSGGGAFSLDWWMVVLIGVIIILISIGAIFGMRRKAKESDARAAFKDMPSVMSQMADDNPPPPPQQGQPPQGDGPQQPPGEGR